MTPQEIIKKIAVDFANFLKDECFYNITGYMMNDQLTLDDTSDHNEYQIDELYDYWIQNIYK